METVFWDYALPCLCAFLACVGFTLMFNIHGCGKLIAGVGGALGWLVYLLGGKGIFSAFLAAGFFSALASAFSALGLRTGFLRTQRRIRADMGGRSTARDCCWS